MFHADFGGVTIPHSNMPQSTGNNHPAGKPAMIPSLEGSFLCHPVHMENTFMAC